MRAHELAVSSGARLRLVAARKGGDAGLALACATIDMVLSQGTHPAGWPIGEMIRLLEQDSPGHDRQVDRLLKELRGLQVAIDDLDRDDCDEAAPAEMSRRAA